jgi:hypothetical protein
LDACGFRGHGLGLKIQNTDYFTERQGLVQSCGQSGAGIQNPRPYRVLILVRSLSAGGAERQVVNLSRGLAEAGLAVSVLTFYPGGLLEDEVRRLPGGEFVCLGKRGRWDVGRFMFGLLCEVWRRRPCVLLSYLTVPNIMAAVCRLVLPGIRVIWGIRHSCG